MAATSSQAFFGDSNMEFPLADNNPYGNGMFAYNGYDVWDPRWYAREAENMMNEFDDEISNDTTFYPSNYQTNQ